MRNPLLAAFAIVSMLLAPDAGATTSYGNHNGTDVDFNDVRDTSTGGDPEPACCFGSPTASGNQLLFFPTSFSASAAGAGGNDQTSAQLQLQIAATTALYTIDTILLDEFGDATLTGVGGPGTGTFASMSGFVTVLATTSGPIAPVAIGFTGTFSPTDLLLLPGDSGTTLWTGSAVIDVASVVPNATLVELSFDNDLSAFSEEDTTAKIQKKVVSGPAVIITVIPEPSTALLLSVALFALGLRGRSRRS